MVKRPDGMNAFEFVVLCGLRAAQLQRGCTPRVPPSPKVAVTAQHELAERKIVRSRQTVAANSEPAADEEVDAARSSD
jgi:DNA-directed RNA polymerase subunit K/omega